MVNAFAEWLKLQPRGAASRVASRTGISYPTVLRAKAGLRVLKSTAELISEATGGAVAVTDIPQVRVGRDRFADADEPRRVA